MRLLTVTDTIIRQYLPVFFDSIGQSLPAVQIRQLDPIDDEFNVLNTTRILQRIYEDQPYDEWGSVVRQITKWCESAIYAALLNNPSDFNKSVDRINILLRERLYEPLN
jgi:hypothetical protein